jgi:hypothetical protein
MGYYTTGKVTKKYRVTIEEYQVWTEHPDADELKKPLDTHGVSPTPIEKSEWLVTDQTETSRVGVLASALRGIAEEIEPKKPTTRSGDY